jgi:hypothetical protein
MMRNKEPIPMEEIREEYRNVIEQLRSITIPWNKDFEIVSFNILRKTISNSSGTFYGDLKFLSNRATDEHRISRFTIRIMNGTWKVKIFDFATTTDDGDKNINLRSENDISGVCQKIYKKIQAGEPTLEDTPIQVFSFNDMALYKGRAASERIGYRRYIAFFVKYKNYDVYTWIWVSKLETARGLFYKWQFATADDPNPDVYFTEDEIALMSRRGRKKGSTKPSAVQSALTTIIEDINKSLKTKVTEAKIIVTKRIGHMNLYIVWAKTSRKTEFHFLMSLYDGELRYTLQAYQAETVEDVIVKNLFNDSNSKVVKL